MTNPMPTTASAYDASTAVASSLSESNKNATVADSSLNFAGSATIASPASETPSAKAPSVVFDQDQHEQHHSEPARVEQLRNLLLASIAKAVPCDAILLSGGVDTSILAEGAFAAWQRQLLTDDQNTLNNHPLDPFSTKQPPPLRGAVTVLCTDQATDEFYADRISRRCGLTQEVVKINLESVLEELEFCIRVLETFDPMELRNSIVIARGLSVAAKLGYKSVMTGDGADELFAGYSFLHAMPAEKLKAYSDNLTTTMRFSGIKLGAALGIELRQPFLDKEVVEFSKTCSREEKINYFFHSSERKDQDHLEGLQLHGKFILREAFQEEAFSAWRKKEPIEVGSGTTILPKIFAAAMSIQELEAEKARILQQDGVTIRDAEHLSYYRAFKRVYDKVPLNQMPAKLTKDGRDPCPGCGFNKHKPLQTFCTVCGWWAGWVDPGTTTATTSNSGATGTVASSN